VLVELRRQLHEIARDIGAGDQRIGHVRKEAVQRVAELVEEGARVVRRREAPACPVAGFEKFITLMTIGRTSPVRRCWSRSPFIQAPLRLEAPREIVADEQPGQRPPCVTFQTRTSG